MIRFRVLNDHNDRVEPTVDEEHVPLEVQIEQAFDVYTRGLRHQAKKRFAEAREVFEKLVQTDVMKEPLPVGESVQGSPLHKLHYLLHKNWGNLEEAEGRYEDALTHYREAVNIEAADVLIWSNIGNLLMRQRRLGEAREAYEIGLRKADTRVLYEIGDFRNCLRVVNEALKADPGYVRGAWIKAQIVQEHLDCRSLTSSIGEDITPMDIIELMQRNDVKLLGDQGTPRQMQPSGDYDVEHTSHSVAIQQSTWEGVAHTLLTTYWQLLGSSKPASLTSKLDFIVPEGWGDDNNATLPAESGSQATLDEDATQADIEPPATEMVIDEPVNEGNGAREDSPSRKRKRNTEEKRDAPRSSKRVRDKMEQEQQRKVMDDIESIDSLERWLPVGVSLRCDRCHNDGRRLEHMAAIVPDTDEFVSSFMAKLLAQRESGTPARRTRKRRGTVRPTFGSPSKQRSNDPPHPRFSQTSLNSALNNLQKCNFGTLGAMKEFVHSVLLSNYEEIDERSKGKGTQNVVKWPEGLSEAVSSMISILEKHDGPTFLLDRVDEVHQLETLITACELLLDRIHQSKETSVTDKEENEESLEPNPLLSGRRIDVLNRMWTVALEKFYERGEEGVGKGFVVRFRWLDSQLCEMKGRTEDAAEVLNDMLGLFDVAEGEQDVAVVLPHCRHHSSITPASVQQRLRNLKCRQHILNAGSTAARGDSEGLIRLLAPIFLGGDGGGGREGDEMEIDGGDGEHEEEIARMSREFVFGDLDGEQRGELGDLLVEALEKTGEEERAWVALVVVFVETVVLFGRGVDVGRGVHTISTLLHRILAKLSSPTSTTTLMTALRIPAPSVPVLTDTTADLQSYFISSVILCVQMSSAYAVHVREVGGVDKLVGPASSNSVREFCVRAWCVLYEVLRFFFAEQDEKGVGRRWMVGGEGAVEIEMSEGGPSGGVALEEGNVETLQGSGRANGVEMKGVQYDDLGEILCFVHDLLGGAGLCGDDDGRLLRLIHRHFTEDSFEVYQREIYQCYHCLYGVTVRVDPNLIIEPHLRSHREFEREGATQVFETVAKYAKKKIDERQYRSITNDVRACLDKVEMVFSEPPWENARVAVNRELITSYIASEIDLESVSPGVASRLGGVLEFSEEDRVKLSEVYFNLYYIQGRIQWAVAKQASKKDNRNWEKIVEWLEYAAEQFAYHLYLNPKSFEAWVALASSYVSLANEFLQRNAGGINREKSMIREFQKKAFNSFVQATKLIPTTKEAKNAFMETHGGRKEVASSLWGEFGYLLFGILTKPMNASVLDSFLPRAQSEWRKRDRGIGMGEVGRVTSDMEEMEGGEGRGKEEAVRYGMELAAYCFRQAGSLDREEWQWVFMVGKVYGKLGKSVQTVLSQYQRAIGLVPEAWHTKEQEKILDPSIKLISYLAKLLFERKIEPNNVISILDEVLPKSPPPSTVGSAPNTAPSSPRRSQTPPSLESAIATLEVNANGETVVDERRAAFDRLLHELRRVEAIDKKQSNQSRGPGWQHKPYYRIAWLLYHVYDDASGALEELLTIFGLKTSAKTIIVRFWKPEFERPGKHFVYVHKYTLFLIELARKARDVETLRQLCNRLRKADDSLLEGKEVWERAYAGLRQVVQDTSDGGCTRLSGTMTKAAFERRATEVESRMTAGYQDGEPSERLKCLTGAFDLKKFCGDVGEEEEEALNLLLVDTYSSWFLEVVGGGLEEGEGNEGGGGSSGGGGGGGEMVKFGDVLARVRSLSRNPPGSSRRGGRTSAAMKIEVEGEASSQPPVQEGAVEDGERDEAVGEEGGNDGRRGEDVDAAGIDEASMEVDEVEARTEAPVSDAVIATTDHVAFKEELREAINGNGSGGRVDDGDETLDIEDSLAVGDVHLDSQ
ncbi:Histone transcription regulator 3 [Rhizophlyctis rosea]|nr:Histone transcription regulator 3 [Rhizophlyctis rosea]